MIGVQIKKGDNPNEVILQGNALGNASGTWYPMITIPEGCAGQLRTLFFSTGFPHTGTWQIHNVRVQRGAVTLWAHSHTTDHGTIVHHIGGQHYDVGIEVQPGDTIDYYITGTPSFSATGYATATVVLPASSTRFVSSDEYPVCGLLHVDVGRPDICRLAALSALLTYLQTADPHLFGGIPTRMEAL